MQIASTDVDFMLRSAQNCKKYTFLDNLQTITQEGNMETRQMTPFFLATFSTLNVCNIHFFLFENSQNPFWCDPRFGPSWSVKYLNFGQKLPIRTTHHTFLESRHPEVTNNPYHVLPPSGAKKRHQLLDYYIEPHDYSAAFS